jgi:hypothetical protein
MSVARTGQTSAERLMQYWQYWQYFYDTQAADGCQGGCLVVKLGAEIADLSEAMRVTTKAGTTAIIDRLERMIADGIADGSVSVGDGPRETAETLYNLWLGRACWRRSTAALNNSTAPWQPRASSCTSDQPHVASQFTCCSSTGSNVSIAAESTVATSIVRATASASSRRRASRWCSSASSAACWSSEP